MENIAFDAHKRYSLCSVEDAGGQVLAEDRVDHERGALSSWLGQFVPGSPVALETIGNWYWIVDEIEAAGMVPRLVHARKAKLMMGCLNKTDRLDVRGLNRLQRTGTLPVVWIPPGDLRDKRDLTRTRMYLVHVRTGLKNRLHATLAKYALGVRGVSDIFGKRSREHLRGQLQRLPEQTRYAAFCQLAEVELLDDQIGELEGRMRAVLGETKAVGLLQTMPGIGFLLATVVSLEVGDVGRFGGSSRLASYAGTVPRIHQSGGVRRFGRLRPDVNRYLKWAYSEAANSVAINRKIYPQRHVSRLYERIRSRKGHAKAIGAVSRHLAEATYWVLRKGEAYREPISMSVRPRGSKRVRVMSS